MFHKILVPLDGSALAERALSPAMKLAQETHGDVTLLRVPWVHPVASRAAAVGARYSWYALRRLVSNLRQPLKRLPQLRVSCLDSLRSTRGGDTRLDTRAHIVAAERISRLGVFLGAS